ncbi:hypothetical protein DRO54_06585 [Candidatus Bathyarchaeota archaeon]|nr:MAG: hypothetical protein DRO54_06585 [Candidatus Bathyarchaeota archaeon]
MMNIKTYDFKPRIVEGLQIKFLKEDERGKFYVIGKAHGSTLLKVHEVGKEIIEMLDGTKSLADIEEILKQKKIEVDLEEFILLLGENGFLENYEVERKKFEEDKKLRIFYFSLVKNIENFINRVYSVLSPIFRWKLFWLLVSFISIVSSFFVALVISGYLNPQTFIFFRGSALFAFVVYMLIIAPFLVALHELAHAITCVHYGGKPKELGIGFYLFTPFFYIDVSDVWFLEKKHSMMVFLAGPLMNLLIGSVSFLFSLSPFLPESLRSLMLMVTFWAYMATLAGFNPVIEGDGYYILQVMLNFPNLNSNTWSYISMWLKRRMRLISKEKYEDFLTCYSEKERKILRVYSPCVLLVNSFLIYIMIVWGFFLLQEYFRITYLIVTSPSEIPASTIFLWVIQSFYAVLLFIFIPYRLFKRLLATLKLKSIISIFRNRTA